MKGHNRANDFGHCMAGVTCRDNLSGFSLAVPVRLLSGEAINRALQQRPRGGHGNVS